MIVALVTTPNQSVSNVSVEKSFANHPNGPDIMISISERIRVLNGFGPYLRILEAFNWENFHRKDWPTLAKNCNYTMRVSVIILMFTISIWSTIRFCVDSNFSLKVVLVELLGVTCAVELFVVCILLSGKTIEIEEARSLLQEIVERREL